MEQKDRRHIGPLEVLDHEQARVASGEEFVAQAVQEVVPLGTDRPVGLLPGRRSVDVDVHKPPPWPERRCTEVGRAIAPGDLDLVEYLRSDRAGDARLPHSGFRGQDEEGSVATSCAACRIDQFVDESLPPEEDVTSSGSSCVTTRPARHRAILDPVRPSVTGSRAAIC